MTDGSATGLSEGVIIFSSDGNFSLFQSRAEIPKIAANDRAKATPEEAQKRYDAPHRLEARTSTLANFEN
jgi:hypothetical protein